MQPKTGLGAGTHNETITFASDHATSDSVDVSFTVNDAAYAVSADKNTLAFGNEIVGYATAPAAQQVTITNDGNLSVTLTLPTCTGYTIATSDSLTLVPAATATFSIQPKTGLAAGTHNETIHFQTDHLTSDSVDVNFTVNDAAYAVSADKASLAFGSAIEGYATAPAAQQVTITNDGNLSVTLTLPTSTDYTIATSDSLTLAPAGTATFSIQPKTGLTAGAHNETITFASDHLTSDSVDVSFTVNDAAYAVSADKASLAFGSAIEGYATAPAAQQVTITNDGNLSVTLTLPTSTGYTITTSDSLTLAPAATATFSIQPKTGLTAGTHNETITFASDHATSDSVDVSFTVQAAQYTLAVSPATLDFGSEIAGYASVAAQTVLVTNTGNRITTLTQPTATDYTVGPLSRNVLNPGATATFTVTPHTGLATGTYAETIAVTGSGLSSAGVDASFTVVHNDYPIGGGGTYYFNGTSGLTFTSNGTYANFTGVTGDGTPLTNAQYSAAPGSTIITLFPAYLDTLSAGTHELRVLFTDGVSAINFTVSHAPTPPDTGDTRPIALYVLLILLSLSGLALLLRKLSKR